MTVTYAILPNVRHGCDLTRPAGRPPRLPACFATCNDNDLATSYVLGELVRICGLCHHVILLSRHPASTCRDGLFGACSTGQKECKASLVGQHANPRLCTANAPNRSLGSSPNCERICKPSQRPLGLKPANPVHQTIQLHFQ